MTASISKGFALAAEAKEIAKEDSGDALKFLNRHTWDAFAFVDLCERAAGSPSEMLCRRVQQREWELLFDYCYRRAIG